MTSVTASQRKSRGAAIGSELVSCSVLGSSERYWLREIVFSVLILTHASCSQEVTVLLECPSPDHLMTASFSNYSGGGAAGYQFQRVSIHTSEGTVAPQSYPVELKGAYHIRFTWRTPELLLVEYPSDARVDRQIPRFVVDNKTINLEYRTVPSKGGLFIHGDSECRQ